MTLAPGQMLNQYRLVEKIGEGGMGQVWAAEDPSLKRKIAIKVLPIEMAEHAERRARFTREAQSVAALNHPNIVTIHSVEECDGLHFLTMELVDGEPLTARIGKDGLTLPDFFLLAIPLTDALAAAHEQGITHRDLKPDNVMITRDGRVKVLDFGLAKLTDAAEATLNQNAVLPTQTVTAEGRIVGTVNYMSPEQAEGKPTDARSDVFSLGILIYEMTTGRRPFKGDTPISTITSILRDTPLAIGELRNDLPGHLDRVIRRSLAKEPARRYQSALELRNELEELREEIQSGASVEQPRVPAQKVGAAGNRKLILWFAGIALIAVVAVAIMMNRDRLPQGDGGSDVAVERRHMIVVLPFENIGNPDGQYFVDGITEEVISRLASVKELGVISRTSAFRYDREGKSTAQIGADFGVDYLLEGSVRWAGESRVRVIPSLVRISNDVGVWSEPFDEIIDDVFKLQSDIASAVVQELGVVLLEPERRRVEARPTESSQAYQAYLRGLSARAHADNRSELMEAAIDALAQATEFDPGFAAAWAELSIAHAQYFHFGYDRTAARQALSRQAVDRALEIAPDLPEAHKALGYYYYWGLKDYDSALAAFAVAEESLSGDEELVSGIGFVYRRQGRFEEAADRLQDAAILNPQDPTAYRNLGETYGCLRRFDDAIEAYEKAIAIAQDLAETVTQFARVVRVRNGDEQRSGELLRNFPFQDDPWLVHGWWSHHLAFGNYDAALAAANRLDRPRITVNEYAPVPLMIAQTHSLFGNAEPATDAFRIALDELDLELAERADDFRIHAARGLALAGLGRNAEAIQAARRAVEILPITTDALAGSTQLEMLAQVYVNTGEIEQAREVARQLLSIPSLNTEYNFRHEPIWAALEWD